MAKKREKTPEEIAEIKRVNDFNRAFRNQVTIVKNACKAQTLRTIELQLEFMKNSDVFTLPNKLLDRISTISAFEQGISKFKEDNFLI